MQKKNLFDELKLFSETGFREIYKRFIYINCRKLLDEMLPGELDDHITGIFAYCYIDKDEGISFRPVLLAAMSEMSIQVFTFPHQEDTIFVLRLRSGDVKMSELHQNGRHMYLYGVDPDKYAYIDLSVLNVPVEEYSEFKDMIDTSYDPSPDVEELRSEKYAYLDQFRHDLYPDDVRALLFKKENGIEEVWVRLMFRHENELFGRLLNEPYKDYGCHEGTIIGLVLAKSGDDRVLIFNGRTAELAES